MPVFVQHRGRRGLPDQIEDVVGRSRVPEDHIVFGQQVAPGTGGAQTVAPDDFVDEDPAAARIDLEKLVQKDLDVVSGPPIAVEEQ